MGVAPFVALSTGARPKPVINNRTGQIMNMKEVSKLVLALALLTGPSPKLINFPK